MAINDDIATLVRLIRWIKQTLEAARDRVPHEHRISDDPWDEIAAELDAAITTIKGITSEHSKGWRELAAHGLTGRQLIFKVEVVKKLISRDVWDDILDFINTLLDSLGLTMVAEYKDAIWKLASDGPLVVPIPQLGP